MNPDQWLTEASRGDVTAFNRLVDYHQSMAYHIAFHHLGDADDALDACQEAMVSAWHAMPRFEGDLAGFRAWLARIVVNQCRDYLRYDRRRPRSPLEVQDDDGWRTLPLPDPGESPESYAERADQRQLLEHAIGRLSEDHRTVVLLDHVGFSYAEIATIVGIETGTVKSRLSRARARLRDILLGSGTQAVAAESEPPVTPRRSREEPAREEPASTNGFLRGTRDQPTAQDEET